MSMARCDSLLLALDFVLLGSILLIRSFAQLGSAVPVLDFLRLGSLLSSRSHTHLGLAALILGLSRLDLVFLPLVTDYTHSGLLLFARSSA